MSSAQSSTTLNNKATIYDANFTAGGLLLHEFQALESILTQEGVEEALITERSANEFVGIKTDAARKRILLEVWRRYQAVPVEFWEHLYSCDVREQRLALFYLVLKTYPLVRDLHFDVAVRKQRTSGSLEAFDVTAYLDGVAGRDEEVAKWSQATLDKLASQYRTVLGDCGLWEQGQLQPASHVSETFKSHYITAGEGWFLEACFLALS